jgi:ABC-type Fe3+/spermidine/putrescine transport system ATPase subunit
VSSDAVVEVHDVVKRYGVSTALSGVSFTITRGECVALLGPSGCGKTTTLRIIAGFEHPDSGRIAIGGEEVGRAPAYERPIGLVFQDYALFPHMNVAENVEYGLKRRGIGRKERAERRLEVLRLVRLTGFDDRRPMQLSGGQQQRVALARALAPGPAVLLLDEPLSNLDARLRHDLRHELRSILSAARTTTLMVTHDQEEAIAMADRIVLMNSGRVEQTGAPQELYDRPGTRFAANFLGRCNWISGERLRLEGRAAFRSASGLQFPAVMDDARASQTNAGLAIRPERVRITRIDEAPGEHANRFRGVVVSRQYLGSDLRMFVEIAQKERLETVLKIDGRILPAVGEEVRVGIDRDACVVIHEGA